MSEPSYTLSQRQRSEHAYCPNLPGSLIFRSWFRRSLESGLVCRTGGRRLARFRRLLFDLERGLRGLGLHLRDELRPLPAEIEVRHFLRVLSRALVAGVLEL